MKRSGSNFARVLIVFLILWFGRTLNSATVSPTNYFIIVTGGELLEGVYPDAHTSFITRTLLPLGLRCVGSMIVDDDRDDIKSALSYATNKTSLIIVTGGLGPTDNDITRETLSDFTGIQLRKNPDLIEQMEKRLNTPREKLRDNLIKQTMVPVSGGYLKNPAGTAAALIFEASGYEIIALPGPPRELRRIVTDELLPYLSKKYGFHPPKLTRTVRFIGLGQSQIDDTLKKVLKIDPDIIVTSLFEYGRVDFFFSMKNDTPENRNRLDELVRKIKDHFGSAVYSTDNHTLEDVVSYNLEQKNIRAIVADAAGGFFIKKIQESDHFRNILIIAVSAATNKKLAVHLKLDSDRWEKLKTPREQAEFIATGLVAGKEKILGICIGEPVKKADGYSVTVAINLAGGFSETFEASIFDLSDTSLFNLTTQILDRLRRRLIP